MGITTAGMTGVANLIGTTTTGSGFTYRWIMIGTSATAFNISQTTGVAEIQRMASTTQTVGSNTLTTVADYFSFGGGAQTVNECGLTSSVTLNTGNMLCRALTGAIACGVTDTLKVTITVEVKQGA